ncbi:AMP-binding protein [Prescottella defluvii]|nr:AMP-binding protein [Prescottella defluvii]
MALEFDGESLTYAEFDARANRLARHLISLGVGPDSMVGLGIRRSFDLLVGMYAIVKAGGAYVPLDPDHPADRLGYVLDIACPTVILTTTRDGLTVDTTTSVSRSTPWTSTDCRPTRSPTTTASRRCRRTTSRTSSSRPAPRAAPRAWPSGTVRSSRTCVGGRACTR